MVLDKEQLMILCEAVENNPYTPDAYAALADYLEETADDDNGHEDKAANLRDAITWLEDNPKCVALAQHLEIAPSVFDDGSIDFFDVLISEEPGDTYGTHGKEYLVLTDDEADERCDDSLKSYLDDCVMREIPEHLRYYFDEEKWKRDTRANTDRGSTLGCYDGNEYEETVDGVTYYLYRTN